MTTTTVLYSGVKPERKAPRELPVTLDGLPDSQLLDPEQVGSVMRVSPDTLAVWRSTGRYNLRYVKSGYRVYYRVGDIREFLERRTRGHTSGAGN